MIVAPALVSGNGVPKLTISDLLHNYTVSYMYSGANALSPPPPSPSPTSLQNPN